MTILMNTSIGVEYANILQKILENSFRYWHDRIDRVPHHVDIQLPLRIATPIFLSFIIYWMIEPLARFLHKRRMKKSLATAISMLLFVIVILSLIAGALLIFIAQITNLVDKLPEYTGIVQRQLVVQTDNLTDKYDALPDNLSAKVTEAGRIIVEKATPS